MSPKDYLNLVQSQNLTPNFWMSEEYIEKKGLVWCRDSKSLLEGFKETSESNEWFFLPIYDSMFWFNSNAIYCGFLRQDNSPYQDIFLDYQFIYDPKDFLNMEGHKWATFRKNVKKYPHRKTTGYPFYTNLYTDEDEDETKNEIIEFITNWSIRKENKIYDPEILVKYALQGQHRKVLFFEERLVGINIWDENFKFINFRYCIDNGEPFLNEYMRYLFYTDPEIQNKNKLVNDGGSLDSEGLFNFKKKLNPIEILKVYSYKGVK